MEIQHASIVLHVGEVAWRLEGPHALRQVIGLNDAIEIQPGEIVSVVTDERVRLPGFASARIFSKGRMPLLGLLCASTTIDPGFDGYLYVTVVNDGGVGVRLPRGLAIAKAEVERLAHSAGRLYGSHEDAKTSLPRDDYLFIGAHAPKGLLSPKEMPRRISDLERRIARMEAAGVERTRRQRIGMAMLLLCALLASAAVLPHPLGTWLQAPAAGQSRDLFRGVGVGILLTAVLATCRAVYRHKRTIAGWLRGLFGQAQAVPEHPDEEGETDAGDRQGAGAPG